MINVLKAAFFKNCSKSSYYDGQIKMQNGQTEVQNNEGMHFHCNKN